MHEYHLYIWYTLLPEESGADNNLLDEVLNLIPDDIISNLASAMTDFEKSAIKAFTSHFAQNLPAHPQSTLLAAKLQKEQHRLSIKGEHHRTERKGPRSWKKLKEVGKPDESVLGAHFLGLGLTTDPVI